MKYILSIFLALLCTALVSKGQAPKAVLVMLKAEKNRITALEKQNKKKQADLVRKEASIIMEKTVNDFNDRFKYCAVYYFMDTNANFIREKKFENILFDENFKPYSASPIKPGDSSFIIVYYGIPPISLQKEGRGGVPDNTYRPDGYLNKGLVLLGHDFDRIKKKSFFYRYETWWPKVAITKYDFVSANFDMAYLHSAGKLQAILTEEY